MSTTNQRQRLVDLLSDGSLRTMEQLEEHGFTRSAVYRAVEGEAAYQYAKGIYTSFPPCIVEGMPFAAMTLMVPGVVCLGSAAQYHGISDEDPNEIWYAVDRTKVGRSTFPRMQAEHKVLFWSPEAMEPGIDVVRIAGVDVRITSKARTVVDLLRYRGKITDEPGIKAMKDYLRQGEPVGTLERVAEALGVHHDLRPYTESAKHLQEAMEASNESRPRP